MSTVVTRGSDGRYLIEINVPESIWIDRLCSIFHTDDVTVIGMVFGAGLVDVLCKFYNPTDIPEPKDNGT